MTILSDRRIRQLCIVPMHRLDEDTYYRRLGEPRFSTLVFNTDPRDDILLAAEREDKLRRECTVETTPKERAAFVPMIMPFNPQQLRARDRVTDDINDQIAPLKIISCGTTSYGYDVTLADEFKIFTNIHSTLIDPKRLDTRCLVDGKVHVDEETGERYVIMPPNSYLLGRTVEYFRMPRDIVAICLGKSTYARAGAIVNVTPIEPGFEGHVVIEISNSTSLPMKIYADEGISQFMFFQGSEPCEISYADRGGKYQGQTGITLPKV